ncbi:hypothetical protein [Sulfurospirillum cavolei]|uniref:hypothetical protein n=1 Tax=Sulfurospirillum cavolei TaxID=366522 RepID=UPI000764872E|nr:hypothetical protein [Sulfurospirillum cavolei]
MIEIGKYDHFGTKEDYITIDLSDKKHSNRVINFLKRNNILTGAHEFTIQAQWTAAQFHPDMVMKEDDFLDFADAINQLAEKIKDRRENKES